ncbi:tetratricopeptide repeat protein [Pelomyxa schiedti]|nr:tetratricopeptide repeat protein [Pelomyxa schiedti]
MMMLQRQHLKASLDDLRSSGFIQQDEYDTRMAEVADQEQQQAALLAATSAAAAAAAAAATTTTSGDDEDDDAEGNGEYGGGKGGKGDGGDGTGPVVVAEYRYKPAEEDVERSLRLATNAAGGRRIRLFVSSTLKDMEAERLLLVKKVFPEVRKVCGEKGISFVDVDFRWGITGDDASGGKVISICLKEIDRCRPYMIGLLGSRYGWSQKSTDVPDKVLEESFRQAEQDFPWLEHYTDRSITELEMLYGALFHPKYATGCLFYFRNPAYVNGLTIEQQKKFRSKHPVSLDMLEDLKARIRGSKLPVRDNYNNPDEFASLVLSDLLALIERDFPTNATISPMQAAVAVHTLFASMRSQAYIGRYEYNNVIERHLKENNTLPLVITGDSGSGKSSMLASWIHQYLEEQHQLSTPSEDFLFFHFIELSDPEVHKVVYRLEESLKTYFSLEKDLSTQQDLILFELPQWIKLSASAATKRHCKIVCILDGLDHLESKAHNLLWLPVEFPQIFRVIVSARMGTTPYSNLVSRKYPQLCTEPLSDVERRKLIHEYLGLYSKRLGEQEIFQLLQCRLTSSPIFLRTILEQVRVHGSFSDLSKTIAGYVESSSVPELFVKVLTQWQHDYNTPLWPTIVQDTFSLLFVSRNGLLEEEIVGMLGIQPAVWNNFSCVASEILLNKSGLLDLSHSFLRQAVEKLFVPNDEVRLGYRRKITLYFSTQPLSPRKLYEYPYQLEITSDAEGMRTFLGDINVLVRLYNDSDKYDLFRWWGVSGDNRGAVACYKSSLESLQRSHTATNEEILTIQYKLALFLSESGVISEAITVMAEVLEKTKQLKGSECRDVADVTHEMAQMYVQQANIPQGKLMAQEAYEMRKRVNAGRIHRAQSMALLALILKKEGEYEGAEKLITEAIEIAENRLGPSHPTVSKYISILADCYRKEAHHLKAEELYRRCLEIDRNAFGNAHPHVAECLTNLGQVLKDRGQYKEALPLYQEALSTMESIFGTEHIKCAVICTALADLQRKFANWSAATQLYERALRINQTNLGTQHPEVAENLNALALVYKALSETDRAEALVQQAIQIIKTVYNPEHIKVALYLNTLASIYAHKGKYRDANEMYNQAMKINKSHFGMDHPEVADNLTNLGLVARKLGQFDTAFEYFSQALEIIKKVFGSEHPKVALLLHELGVIHRKRRKLDESSECFQAALDLNQRLYGDSHPLLAADLNGLGQVEKKRGNLDESAALHARALEINTASFGPNDTNVALTLNYMAEVYRSQGKFVGYDETSAEGMYVRALEINREAYGTEHPEIAENLNGLAQVYKSQMNYLKAEKLFIEGVAMSRKLLGDDSPHVLNRYMNLLSLYETWGQVDKHKQILADIEALKQSLLVKNTPGPGSHNV